MEVAVRGRGSSFQSMRMAVQELFNLYMGRSLNPRTEDSARETAFQLRKRITAINRDLPPRNEQFLLDFQQLQGQFLDQDQLRSATESVLFVLIVQCSNHTLQAEFLQFALQMLSGINFINWDSFLSSLLSAVSAAEASSGQSGLANTGTPSISSPAAGSIQTIPTSLTAQASNPASPLTSLHIIGSPPHGLVDPAATVNQSPIKGSDLSHGGQQMHSRGSGLSKGSVMGSLRQLVCKIVLSGLEHDLKPITHADIFSHMLNWLLSWNPRQQNKIDEQDNPNLRRPERTSCDWLHSSLDVVWALVGEDRCRVPFYELLHSGIQFVDNVPDEEALFTLILEIHRRREKIAIHMQMLDQHLHCPTFATPRNAAQIYTSIPGESLQLQTLRIAPLTYPSVLGEPLHGEDIATAIQRGSLDWERALRCLRHALHTMPSPDWWRRVLAIALCYRQHAQQQMAFPGLVFSSEMVCEAIIDRIVELMQPLSTSVSVSSTSNISIAEANRWQEWLSFADLFFFLTKNGYIDFLDFVDKLASRFTSGEQQIVRTNHVTWLLAQVFRIELVQNALTTDPNKMETTRKILSFHKEERPSDQSSPQSTLLEFISSSQTLRVWSINPSIRENLNPEQLQKGRQIDEWWKQVTKGERVLDYLNLDDKSMGMFWALSHTMTQPACDAIMNCFNSNGRADVILQGSIGQPTERLTVMHETRPLPMTLLSGLSLFLCLRLASQIEETMFSGQVVPSIAMVETYVRLLLTAPHSLFRLHFNSLQRYQTGMSKTGFLLILFEMLNCRLIPLYRYHGKVKQLIYDFTKIVVTFKGKRGEHRLFRLAENLCINLILSLQEIISAKKELKGQTEFTETLNRIMVINLAITIKTRGIAEFDQMFVLQHLLEQVLGTTQHVWSEKTMRHFPSLFRDNDLFRGRIDKRGQSIQAWQQAESTVINQCRQLLSSAVDSAYVGTYISHSFPQHRQYLCAGAWMIMDGHPETINTANLGRVLKELSPEEVTSNIYTMVDVLLHNIQLQVQHGHNLQDLLLKSSASLAFFMWTHELLPVDIVLLALIDRDDDPHALRLVVGLLLDRQEFQQRVNHYYINRGQSEHWLNPGPFQRVEPQQALGNHLSGKDRYPVFFDDMVVRALPVIPLIIYRLIENDATDTAEKVLATYSRLMVYHPLRFTFVRDILAYFYGCIPSKLVVRILSILDIPKIPFSEAFLQHIGSSNSALCPPSDYFANLLLSLVKNVVPPIRSSAFMGDSFGTFSRTGGNRGQAAVQSVASNVPESQKVFYQNQDPGTYTQLLLDTAVIEILSLPTPCHQIVSTLVQVVVHVQPTQVQSSLSMQSMSSGISQSSNLPTSPSGGTADSISTNRSAASAPGLNATSIGNNSAVQSSSCLMIQACGLLLAQLPPTFHIQFYAETARIIKDCWWLTDVTKSSFELDTAFGYALWDPTWAFQDNTSTTIGNLVALVHAFFSNLPYEWLEGTHAIIQNLRPITTIAQLRLAFRIMGPLLPRIVIARPLFKKTLALLFSVLGDVFGRNSQTSIPVEPTEISDLIDFLHHAVMYEAQASAQNGGKPKPEILSLCSKAVELLRPELQHLLCHLTTDTNSSMYAATHPKIGQRPPSPLAGAGVM